MRLSLYARFKDEHKKALADHYAKHPFTHNTIIEALSSEYYFTEVKYGIASDIQYVCKVDFFGNAFHPNNFKDE